MMNYDNSSVRRQDRLLAEDRAMQLLQTGEYGILSMLTPEGRPYGIPVNYVWDGADALYIHCAPEGRKLRCIAASPEVSFTIVGRTHVIARRFTTNYESLVLTCHACTGLHADERMQALRLLIQKYAPDHCSVGEKYAQGSFHRTEIIKLTVKEFSGKAKDVKE